MSQVLVPSSYTFEPIGFLKSAYPDKFGVPRQSGLVKKVFSALKLRPDLQPELALQGLEGFSHVWLQFIFHLNNSTKYHAKIHPPSIRGRKYRSICNKVSAPPESNRVVFGRAN